MAKGTERDCQAKFIGVYLRGKKSLREKDLVLSFMWWPSSALSAFAGAFENGSSQSMHPHAAFRRILHIALVINPTLLLCVLVDAKAILSLESHHCFDLVAKFDVTQ